MKLSLLYETRPYNEMTPKQAAKARRYRESSYKRERKQLGRKASGSNETNKRTTAEWRKKNPEKASQVNKVNYRVRKGELNRVKKGQARHHSNYFDGSEGGRFRAISARTNAKRANEKRVKKDSD